MTILDTLSAVAVGLQAQGIDATVEYPGFLLLPTATGALNIGTANGMWEGDVMGDPPDEYLRPFPMAPLPLTAEAPAIIAAILDGIARDARGGTR